MIQKRIILSTFHLSLFLCMTNGLPLGLVTELVSYFHTSCVYFVNSPKDLKETTTVFNNQYSLFKSGIGSSLINMSYALERSKTFYCNGNKPFFVVTLNNQAIIKFWKQESFRIAGPRWLWYWQNISLPFALEQLTGVNIPFDSEVLLATPEKGTTISLTEVYCLDGPFSLRWLKWGSWEPDTGMTYIPQSFYSRRADLYGITLKVAAGHDPPYDYLIRDQKGTPISMEGYSSEVWKQLENRLNFTSVIHEARENEWGSMGENGTWSGMMGMIVDEEVNAAINSFLMTPARASAVDFLTPLVTSRTSVFIKASGILDSRWTVFLAPFTLLLWISLLSLMLIVAIALFLLGMMCQKYSSKKYEFVYTLPNTLLWIWGTFCNQGHFVTPTQWPCRLVFWTSYLVAIAVIAAYSANFMAFLTFNKPTLPFQSLAGLLREGTYRFGVLAESGLLTYFQNATDETMQKIYEIHIHPNLDTLPREYIHGFQRICKEPRYAYMDGYDTYALYAPQLPCQILTLPEGSFQQHMGIIVSKNLPYRRILKHKLEEMRESGVLLKIYIDKWSQRAEAPDPAPKRIGFGEVIALFALLATAVIGCSVIVVIEKAIYFLNVSIIFNTISK